MILRKFGDGKYEIVGDAYVHGIMDGEVTKDQHGRPKEPTKITLKGEVQCCCMLTAELSLLSEKQQNGG